MNQRPLKRLPLEIRERLLSKTMVSILTPMADPLRFLDDEIVDLYRWRWEVELGYRGIELPMEVR